MPNESSGVDGGPTVSLHGDSQNPAEVAGSEKDLDITDLGQSPELEFVDGYHIPYELPPYVPRPCPCTMQVAMYIMGGGEVIVYLLIIWIYTTFYQNFLDPKNLGHYESVLFRAGKGRGEDNSMQTEETTSYIATLCLVQIILCCFHCLASIILIMGASKKNIFMCGMWMFLMSCLMLIRLIVAFLMPIRVFGWGTLWILIELYFLYAVAAFIREIHFYPQGYVYKPKQVGVFSESEMRMIPKDAEGIGSESKITPPRGQVIYYESIA